MIQGLDEAELYKLKADLDHGAVHLKKLVVAKLKELEARSRGVCATCGSSLADAKKSYTLVFGPDGFKKKASFCELDCLEYFLSKLKAMRKEIRYKIK